jgi:hypothetical protein
MANVTVDRYSNFGKSTSNCIEQIKAALMGFTELQKLDELGTVTRELTNLRRRLDDPLLVKGKIQEPPAVRIENRATERRNFHVQVWMIVGTWAAFIAAAIYPGLAHQQL